MSDGDKNCLLIQQDTESGNNKDVPPVQTTEPPSVQESGRWKGKNKATVDSPDVIHYHGNSYSELRGFVKYCNSERPDDADKDRINFAVEHLKGIPLREWYRYRREHINKEYTWQDFVKVLENALTTEVSGDDTNESLTSYHNNGKLASSASITKPTDPYDIADFLAVMQDRRLDIIPLKWEPDRDVKVGGTANILQGGSVETSDGQQLSFVFKRVHRETSKEVDRHKEYRALLSEIYILGHPVVRHHPNIIGLEGVCWDTVYDEAWPVLVFKRSSYGDLKQFMKSEDGRILDFDTRIKLCREIGNAIILMHSCHAVHGDLKPDNILIFKDVNNQYSAKVADFGYSTLFAQDSESAEVVLPLSWPWTAPEIEDDAAVTFEQAKQADIFSYGLICFWLLCYDTVPRGQVGSDGSPSLHMIWEMKREEDLASLVFVQVRDNIGDDHHLEKDLALKWFFDEALSLNGHTRKLQIGGLSVPFGCIEEPLPLKEEYGRLVSRITKSPFDLVGMFSQFRASGRSTWQTVFRCLEHRAKDHADSAARTLAAYQLAFCYRVGFGVSIDEQKSKFWMEKSNRTQDDLDDAIEMIREDTSSIFKNIMANADYFDQEKPGKAQPSDRQGEGVGADEDTSAENYIPKPLPADVFLFASTAAWIHKSLGIEPGDVRMTMASPNEGEMDEKLDRLCRDQFGWEEGGRSRTRIEFTFNQDDFFNPFPVERSTEVVGKEVDPATPEDREGRLVRSLERKRKVLGPEHDDTLRDMDALCQFYVEHDKPDMAEPMEIHVMNTRKDKLGQPHPSTLRTMEKVAGLCMLRQSWKEAETILLDILDTRKKVSGVNHPNTLKTLEALEYLVRQYASNQMTDEATALTEHVLEAKKKAFGDDNEMTLATMQALALLYGTNPQKYAEAEKLLAEVARQRERLLGRDHPRTLEVMQILAGLHVLRLNEPGMLNKAHQLQVKIHNAKARPPKPEASSAWRGGGCDSPEHSCEHARDFSSSTNSMGQFISQYFEENLDRDLVEGEIHRAEEALEDLDDESLDRSSALARLAEAYVHRFRQHNDPEDLAHAIIWAEQAMMIPPDNHEEKALRLAELGTFHWIRYDLANSPDDLEKSIKYAEDSVTSTLEGDQELAGRIGDLATRLRKKYEETMDHEALEVAIVWVEQAVDAATGDDERRLWWLVLLGKWLEDKYGISQSPYDLDGAIDALNRAEVIMVDDGSRAQLHDQQANLYEERFFNHSHLPEDLNESVRKAEQAVEAVKLLGSDTPTLMGGEIPYGPLLSVLAFKYFSRFGIFKDPEDLVKAIDTIDLANKIVPPESRHRERVMRIHGLVHGLRHNVSRG